MICPVCMKELHWDSDSDTPNEEYIVSFYHCANCGVDVDIYFPVQGENDEERLL